MFRQFGMDRDYFLWIWFWSWRSCAHTSTPLLMHLHSTSWKL